MIPESVRESFMSTAEMLRQQGRQEGRQEGLVLGRQEAILDALEIGFGRVPKSIRKAIYGIHDETRLRSLYQIAVRVAAVDDSAGPVGTRGPRASERQ